MNPQTKHTATLATLATLSDNAVHNSVTAIYNDDYKRLHMATPDYTATLDYIFTLLTTLDYTLYY